MGPPEPLPVAQLSPPRKAGARTARLMLKHRAGRDRGATGQEVAGRGIQGVPRVREERLRWWGRVLREGRSLRPGQGGVGRGGGAGRLSQVFIEAPVDFHNLGHPLPPLPLPPGKPRWL